MSNSTPPPKPRRSINSAPGVYKNLRPEDVGASLNELEFVVSHHEDRLNLNTKNLELEKQERIESDEELANEDKELERKNKELEDQVRQLEGQIIDLRLELAKSSGEKAMLKAISVIIPILISLVGVLLNIFNVFKK